MLKRVLPVSALILVMAYPSLGQTSADCANRLGFSSEQEAFDHPVHLSTSAKEALAAEQSVADVLKDENLTIGTMPEDWFLASEVYLSRSRKADVVVMGNHIARGAYTSAFWVLHKSLRGYDVVLRTDAHDLTLKNTKTNGLCNIETRVVTLSYNSRAEWGFNGRAYEIVKRALEPNGYENSVRPATLRRRATFAQLSNKDREPILESARSWIWRQWRSQTPALAKVSTRDENGGAEDSLFLIDKDPENGQMQVTLKVRRVVWEQDSSTERRHRVVEHETVVASQVRRTEPLSGDLDSEKAFSDNEELPPSKYRLHFTDGHFDLHSL